MQRKRESMGTIMAAQENVALARSLFDLYNNRQSDPAWLDKSIAAFAADAGSRWPQADSAVFRRELP